MVTVGGGALWGSGGLTKAQLDRVLRDMEAAMRASGAALNVIRTRPLPTAAKENAGALSARQHLFIHLHSFAASLASMHRCHNFVCWRCSCASTPPPQPSTHRLAADKLAC